MAKAMGIEYLPFEVLEVIATYLSAADLNRCLGVSRTWYNIFSDNIFWKRQCVGKLCDYLSEAKCLIEPGFKPPSESFMPIQKRRLQFLQEQHLWKNWNSGCYKKEEIEFDFDDSISYNIKVSFLNNDHICLHRTSDTQVWNVAGTPFSVMTISYCLKEMWEANVYKSYENNIVVIQCNVVQVYNISLDSKSWSLNHVFFFNKPEEFSLSITPETDVNGLLQDQSVLSESDIERVICGQYLVAACNDNESPTLHVWNVKTGKKLKEDKCEICKGSFSVELTAPRKPTNKVLVTFTFKNDPESESDEEDALRKSCSIVYDCSELQFLLPTHHYHSGRVMYFDGFFSVVDDDSFKIMRHENRYVKNVARFEATMSLPTAFTFITSVQPMGNSLLISSRKEVFRINPSEVNPSQNPENLRLLKLDFKISHMDVLFNRYCLLHDVHYDSIKEIWKLNNSLRKVLEFPNDSGTFIAANSASSKIVLERGNKLIILNFW